MTHKNSFAALLILLMLLQRFPAQASSWNPTLLVNTETFQIIDDSDTAADIYVRFGDTLNKRLTFERTLDRFNFNDDVYIAGNITASGTASGKIVHAQDELHSSGSLIVQTTGLFKGNLTTRGALSGAALTVMGGTSYLMGNVGIGTASPGAKLDVVGNIIANSVNSIGVYGTSTNNDGVRGDSTNGYGVNGYSLGSTGVYGYSPNGYGVTGNSTNSTGVYGISTSGYGVHGTSVSNEAGYFYRNNVAGTATTAVVNIVQDSATSETNTVLRVQGDGIGDLVNIFDGTTEVFTILDGGNVGISTIAPSEKLEVIGTASGAALYATDSIRSSGSLVWEGAASGASLWVSTFKGAGLVTSCNGDTETLGWNATTQRFECGDDDTGGGSNSAGQGLTLSNGVFSLSPSFSGSIIRAQDTLSSSGTLVLKKYAGTSTGNILTIDTNGLVYDATNKRVGIGTAAPGARLDIIRTGNTGNQFRTSDSEGETAAVRTYSTADGDGLILNQYYAVAGSPYLRNADFVASMSDVAATQMRFFTKNLSGGPALAMLIDKSGNVGIGTASPNYKSTIDSSDGNYFASALLSSSIGTPGNWVGQLYGYTGNTYQKAATIFEGSDANGRGKFHIAMNGVANSSNVAVADAKLTVDYTGNVGIGTTAPTGLLHATVNAADRFMKYQPTSGLADFEIVTNNNVQPVFALKGTGTADLVNVFDNTTEVFTILDGGNVGIGTTAPKAKLDVVGTISGSLLTQNGSTADNYLLGDLGIGTSTPTAGSALHVKSTGQYAFQVENPTTTSAATGYFTNTTNTLYVGVENANGNAIGSTVPYSGVIDSAGNYGLVFMSNALPRMTIAADGFVGIGTTSPSAKFVVKETTASAMPAYFDATHVGTNITNVIGPIISNSSATTNNWAGVLFSDAIGGAAAGLMGVQFTDRANNYGDFAFWTRSAAAATEKMRIMSTGEVGIGTTTPTEKLEIIGTASGRKLFANDALASSGTIAVRSMAKAGSGAFTAIAAEYQTGAYLFGSGASVLALESYTNHKDGSRALAPSILFGYKGVFDTNLYRASGSTLRSDGQFLLTSTDAFNRPVFKIDTAETTGTQNIVEMYSDVTSTQNRVFRFRADGQAYANGSWNSGGADLAEWFATADTGMRPGDLACLDPERPLHVKRCNNMKQRIVGIVSTKPGFVGGQEETFLLAGKIPVLVGLLGQIPVKVVGPVEIGDIIGLSGTVDGVGAALHEARQSACMALESFSGEGIGVITCLAPSPQVWSATLDSE